MNGSCVAVNVRSHAYLFDAFLVFNEELDTWDVNMEPWSLRRTLHWSVYASIVLATHRDKKPKTHILSLKLLVSDLFMQNTAILYSTHKK